MTASSYRDSDPLPETQAGQSALCPLSECFGSQVWRSRLHVHPGQSGCADEIDERRHAPLDVTSVRVAQRAAERWICSANEAAERNTLSDRATLGIAFVPGDLDEKHIRQQLVADTISMRSSPTSSLSFLPTQVSHGVGSPKSYLGQQ